MDVCGRMSAKRRQCGIRPLGEASAGSVQLRGCCVAPGCTTPGGKDAFIGAAAAAAARTSSLGRNPLFFSGRGQKMPLHAHDGVQSKAYTQCAATDGPGCFSVPGAAATVSALKLA